MRCFVHSTILPVTINYGDYNPELLACEEKQRLNSFISVSSRLSLESQATPVCSMLK
jgi:hypothetical protein